MPEPMNDKAIIEVAYQVADNFSKRCWSVPQADLRQEGAKIAFTVRPNFDRNHGSDERGYIYGAVYRHLLNYILDAGTIVTYKHRRKVLADIRSVEIKEVAGHQDTELEQAVERDRWRSQVMTRMRALAGDDADTAIPCLFGDTTPLAAAQRAGVPLGRVLSAIGRLREAISEDTTMQQLHEDGP